MTSEADPDGRTSPRAELRRLGTHPRKALGQHFLRSASVAQRIVALAGASPDEMLVEIGPGLGALTDLLVSAQRDVLLVELDPVLAARAEERYREVSRVRVLCADAARIDWSVTLAAPGVAVGNLPYNAATAILQQLLRHPGRIRRVVAMVQKEVAERMVAVPGSKTYGALSVLTQFDALASVRFTVPPGAFVPPPKVHSAVVTLDAHVLPPVEVGNAERFRRLVRGVFQHRRKQLANSLRGVVADPRELLARIGIDGARRAETLTLEEFALVERESRDA